MMAHRLIVNAENKENRPEKTGRFFASRKKRQEVEEHGNNMEVRQRQKDMAVS